MPFSPLIELPLSLEWQITPITDANYFRFVYRENVGYSYLVVAQARTGTEGLELFRAFRLNLTGQGADIADLEIPPVFLPTQRRLAVRGLGPARSTSPKSLNLLIEATRMNIITPAGSNTTSSVKTEFKQDVATALEVLGANGIRNGGTILNKGTKKLYLNFGSVADKGSHIIVAPGGNADIQANYIGPVSAIWDAVDATPGNSSKAVFIEFVA